MNCTVGNDAIIGDDCKVGECSAIGFKAVLEPGTIVPSGKYVPPKTRWGGNPAKFIGPVEDEHH